MPHADWNMMLALGLLLASALLGGQLAQMIRLPRVTAYLFVGLLLGPQTLNAITARDLVYLDPVGKLAMALVLFNVGCHFTLVVLRRLMRRGLQLSGGELGLTLTLVTGGLLLLGQPWQLALLLGAIALATAPATTILVFKENHSEGPVTELATFLVVINNLMSVVVFEVLLLGIHFMGGALAQPFHIELWHLVRDLIGSIGLGLVAGLVVSYGCGLLAKPRWFVLLVAVATLLLGAAEALHVPYLLTFLAMGITVANLSDQEKEISAELDHFTGLLCVVFFVIHGAELNWRLLFEAGDQGLLLLAPAYLVLRSLGKYFGVYLVARTKREGGQVRRWLGATLVSQAGAAIALAAIAAHPESGLGELGSRLQVVVLSTVVVFELIGPILIQVAVKRAAEVPLRHAIVHTTATPLSEAQLLWQRMLLALGFRPRRSPEGTTFKEVMRRNVKGIPASATFAEVITYIEGSHDNSFPVVDEAGTLVGIIRYEDLRDALFDPELASLVRAEDLSVPCPYVLRSDEPVARIEQPLRDGRDDCIFIVNRSEPPRLVGLIKRRDALSLFARETIGGPDSAVGH